MVEPQVHVYNFLLLLQRQHELEVELRVLTDGIDNLILDPGLSMMLSPEPNNYGEVQLQFQRSLNENNEMIISSHKIEFNDRN